MLNIENDVLFTKIEIYSYFDKEVIRSIIMSIREQLVNERKHTITQLMEMFPRLKIQEDKILSKLEENDKAKTRRELVFDYIDVAGTKYFIDSTGMIYNENMNLVGIQKDDDDNVLFTDVDTEIEQLETELGELKNN